MLSDEKVIAELNAAFVPVEVNITLGGFPESAPGLWPWKLVYAALPNFKNGFVSTVVLDTSGKTAIHDAGDSSIFKVETAANYNPDKFLEFLAESRKRFAASQTKK